jgi:hypothetical protein
MFQEFFREVISLICILRIQFPFNPFFLLAGRISVGKISITQPAFMAVEVHDLKA